MNKVEDLGRAYASGNSEQVNKAIELIQTYMRDITADDFVLDLGCGTGEVTKFLAGYGAPVTGLDISEDMTEHAGKYNTAPKVSYEVTDLQNSEWFMNPERHNQYTRAVSFMVLHWIPDLQRALKNIFHVMAPGGHLLVSQVFKLHQSAYYKDIPMLVSSQKWCTKIHQRHFLKESIPWYSSLFDASRYTWMRDLEALKEIIQASGFETEFIKMDDVHLKPTRDVWLAVLPVMKELSETQQQEFLDDFFMTATGTDSEKRITTPLIVFMLTKHAN